MENSVGVRICRAKDEVRDYPFVGNGRILIQPVDKLDYIKVFSGEINLDFSADFMFRYVEVTWIKYSEP